MGPPFYERVAWTRLLEPSDKYEMELGGGGGKGRGG